MTMPHGRTIKVSYDGQRPALYLVTEPDAGKAMAIVQASIAEKFEAIEDVGHASEALLAALGLKPGDFRKT